MLSPALGVLKYLNGMLYGDGGSEQCDPLPMSKPVLVQLFVRAPNLLIEKINPGIPLRYTGIFTLKF